MTYKKRVTVESLMDEADEARRVAAAERQAGAMIAATQTKAKLAGLWVDRKEQGAPGDFAAIDTRDALLAKARAEHGDAFAEALAQALGQLEAKPQPEPAPLALPSPDAFPRPAQALADSEAGDR